MQWTKDVIQELGELYNASKTDQEIAEKFGTSAANILKSRSRFGFVSYNKTARRTQPSAKPREKRKPGGLICAYVSNDNLNHFISIDSGDMQSAKTIARSIMIKNGLKEITVFAPIKKLVMQQVTEIDL